MLLLVLVLVAVPLTPATLSAGHRRRGRHGQPQADRIVLKVSVVDEHETRLQQHHGQRSRSRGIPTLTGARRVWSGGPRQPGEQGVPAAKAVHGWGEEVGGKSSEEGKCQEFPFCRTI